MTLFGEIKDLSSDEQDIICPVCTIPLLSKKSTCPKCGSKWYPAQPKPATTNSEGAYESDQRHPINSASEVFPPKDDLLTMGMVFSAGLGLLFAVLNLFMSGIAPLDLWRSFMAITASLVLLSLRRLLLNGSR